MKKILLIFLTLIFIAAFSENIKAQEEKLEISLIEYDTETNYARIQVENKLETDLHNVNFQINTLPSKKLVSLLKSGSAVAKILNIPEGIHKITITSDELTVSKELSFSASIKEVQEELEKEQLSKRRRVQKERIIENIIEQNKPVTQEEKGFITLKTVIVTLAILIAAIIIYVIIKKRKNENI